MRDTELREPEAARPPIVLANRLFAWLKKHERRVLVSTVGFQILLLASLTVLRVSTLATGDTVLLRVIPVDPRSMFRGEYVILTYEFSRTPFSDIEGLPDRDRMDWQGRTVYVWLEPEEDGEHWRAERVSIRPPTAGLFLRGSIVGWSRLEFGIESYFVQEGEGRRYEEAILDRRLSAEVAVNRDGSAALRGLRIEQ